MKLAEARKAYYDFSGKASDIARQLCFAALALVWLSAVQGAGGSGLGLDVTLVTGLVVASLLLDLLQYLYGSTAWGLLHRVKRASGVREDQEFRVSAKINWPTNALFWLKLLPVFAAYLVLLHDLLFQ